MTDKSTEWLFESLIPNRLKSILLFEDFDEAYAVLFHGKYILRSEQTDRKPDVAMSRTLAEASLDLESLSASFIVDARYFFQAFQPTWIWNRLRSLVLTSRLLNPDESVGAINHVLHGSASAATKIPTLNTFELWNGGKGLACVFRYRASEHHGPATITWRGNWDLPLKPYVISSWEAVALKHALCGLEVFKELLDAEAVIRPHGDAIYHLRFLGQVAHPVSLRQISVT